MSGVLTEKWKCKQTVRVTERRELSVIELAYELHTVHTAMLERKEENHNKIINLCQLYNKRCLCWLHDTFRYKKCGSLYIM
jgi:hypothetical protein